MKRIVVADGVEVIDTNLYTYLLKRVEFVTYFRRFAIGHCCSIAPFSLKTSFVFLFNRSKFQFWNRRFFHEIVNNPMDYDLRKGRV